MPYYLIVIAVSFVASIFGLFIKENRKIPIVYFPVFLFLTFTIEFYGERLGARRVNTVLLYNYFSFFEFMFYLYFFRCLLQSKTMKRTISIVMILYFIVALSNILFFQGKKNTLGEEGFHTYTYMLGCLLVVIFSIVYFNFLFRFPDTGRLTKNPYFWIVTGLMFFETCTFTFYGLTNFITATMNSYGWFLQSTSDILNTLLYTLFSFGFLCRVNIRKLLGLS